MEQEGLGVAVVLVLVCMHDVSCASSYCAYVELLQAKALVLLRWGQWFNRLTCTGVDGIMGVRRGTG